MVEPTPIRLTLFAQDLQSLLQEVYEQDIERPRMGGCHGTPHGKAPTMVSMAIDFLTCHSLDTAWTRRSQGALQPPQ